MSRNTNRYAMMVEWHLFREKEIKSRYAFITMQPDIQQICTRYFTPGQFYTKPDIKALLQDIYMSLGMIETAKATDITMPDLSLICNL